MNSIKSQGSASPNIIIKGDSKDVLPKLEEKYRNNIKCIYIDPPYNNGDKYKYYNDSTSHIQWMDEMKSILSLLYKFLSDDGSIWISIDDAEMAYLKIMLDEIFGRKNFAATIIWQQRTTRENRSVFSFNHEYILVYAKNLKEFKKTRNLLPVKDDKLVSRYKNPDNDPRGPWQSITATVQAGHAVSSQFYTITAPNGTRHDPPRGRCWVYNQAKMQLEIENNNIWFGKDGNNTPRIKKFLKDARIGLTPETIWPSNEVGTSDSAKKQLKSLLENEEIFETPKPEELIMRILEIATNPGDIVLDCFLGSGTTAAVAHKMNRKYIGIERGEQIEDIVISRLNKVIDGEQTGCSKLTNWTGGGNYSFQIHSSN